MAVRATQATHKPRSLTFEHASGLPLAGLTAYQAIYDGLRLQPGETVLIHRAAGGVGSFAVQLGRIVGAHVIATASRANHDYLRELGASECIDYHEEDPIEEVRASHPDGIDAVLDLVGGETLSRSAEALRRGGRLVSVIEPPDEEAFERRGAHASYLFVLPDGDELRALAMLADDGELRIRLEEAFPLGEARSAHERLEQGHVHGKLALMAEG